MKYLKKITERLKKYGDEKKYEMGGKNIFYIWEKFC